MIDLAHPRLVFQSKENLEEFIPHCIKLCDVFGEEFAIEDGELCSIVRTPPILVPEELINNFALHNPQMFSRLCVQYLRCLDEALREMSAQEAIRYAQYSLQFYRPEQEERL